MKKIFVLVFAMLLIVNLPFNIPFFYNTVHKTSEAVYSFYVLDDVKSEPYFTLINNGGLGTVIRCNVKNSIKVKRKLNSIVGESISFFANRKKAISFISIYKAKLVKTEQIQDNIYIMYAYTNKFPYCILLDNKKINLQIVYSNGVVTLGTPVILGDY